MPVNKNFPNGDKVLLADVAEEDAFNLASFLEMSGFVVRHATTAEEAMAQFLSFTPGVVLVDTSLPAKSWLNLIREIRDHESRQDSDYRCVIIITTGKFSPDLAQKALRAGAHEVLSRPVEQQKLLERIAAHMAFH